MTNGTKKKSQQRPKCHKTPLFFIHPEWFNIVQVSVMKFYGEYLLYKVSVFTQDLTLNPTCKAWSGKTFMVISIFWPLYLINSPAILWYIFFALLAITELNLTLLQLSFFSVTLQTFLTFILCSFFCCCFHFLFHFFSFTFYFLCVPFFWLIIVCHPMS